MLQHKTDLSSSEERREGEQNGSNDLWGGGGVVQKTVLNKWRRWLGGACFLGKHEDWSLDPLNLCQSQLDVVSTCNLGTRRGVHAEMGAPGPA